MIAWVAWFLLWVAHAQGGPDCGAASPPVVPDLQSVVGPAQGPTSDTVVVQASSLFARGPDPVQLAEILQSIANEPGEKGTLAIDLTAGGKFGSGVVNGEVEGAGGLDVYYTMTDVNSVILAMDYEMALKAGVNLA